MRSVDVLRAIYPKGTRVELELMNDFQSPPKGTLGTVTNVDDMGTIHIDWDNGSTLGIVLFAGDMIRRLV